METWLLNALLAMLFAGITAVFAKAGLSGVPADLGLFVRTVVIFILVLALAIRSGLLPDLGQLTTRHWALLSVSGFTAFLSWVFYFRAIQDGPLTVVASLDKASLAVTLILAFLIFKEPLKPQVLLGGGLVLLGMLVLVWK